jgi:hypothetical protein
MATTTTNYGLVKPSYNEPADISVINENMDIIDTEMSNINDDVAGASNKANEALTVAKGKNRALVFNTTADMQTWLSNADNKNKAQVGDNVYIKELDVPDWWISAVLETADAETGYYYAISQLETQKVDMSANSITYDNTDSDLDATNVQGAIDELKNYKISIDNILNEKMPKSGGVFTGGVKFNDGGTFVGAVSFEKKIALGNEVWNHCGNDVAFGDNNVPGLMCFAPQQYGSICGVRFYNYDFQKWSSLYINNAGGLLLENTKGDIFLPTSGAVYVSNANNSARNVIHASAFTVNSSNRVKTNIQDLTEEEARKILELNPVTFDYINKDNGTNCRGLIAEEVASIIPSCVIGNVECADDDEKALQGIGIDYSKLVPYLIKMVQIQQAEIDALKENAM